MKEALAKKNYDYCQDTIAFTKGIAEHFLTLGERLARIRQEELYKPGWETWQDFLEEMHMPESVASRLVNIYLKFVVQYQIPRQKLLSMGGWSDLSEILPYANSKKEVEEMIDTLAPLRRQDRRAVLQEKKTGLPMKDCRHRRAYIIKICPECPYREKIHETNS